MADKDTLWTAVVARYDSGGLISLTNIRSDGEASEINTTVGTEAANGVLNLWPAYAQVAFDITDGLHIETAVLGVIAMLWQRGGSSFTIAEVKWDKVFANEGIIAQIKKTGPRGHRGPSSNSGVTQRVETVDGRRFVPWADRDALPTNWMPSRVRSINDR